MMLNFKTIIVADGLAAASDEEHNASLSALYGQFADADGRRGAAIARARRKARAAA